MPTFMSNCKPVIEWCITSKQTFTIAVIYSRNITGTLIMIITPGPTTHSRNNINVFKKNVYYFGSRFPGIYSKYL